VKRETRKMATNEPPPVPPENGTKETACAASLMSALLGRLASVEAASDAAVLTLTVAALTPVIQASMSFVGAAAAGYHRAIAISANQEAESLAILAQSTNKILEAPPRAPLIAAAAVRNQPEPLAVS